MPFPPYPSDFYYEEKGNEDTYSFTPQGELDVDRFIRNEAPWKKVGAVEQKKKTIVLYDMFWKDIYSLNVNDMYEVVCKLNRDGFDVFLYPFIGYLSHDDYTRKKQLLEWTNILLSRPNTYESDREVMVNAKEKYSLLPDQTQLVNAYWLKVFTSSLTALPDHTLNPFKLTKYDKNFREYIYEKLKNSMPPVSKINCDEFNEFNTEIIQECRKHFPDARVDFSYVFIDLTESQLQKLANGKLTLNGEVITLNDLSRATYFNIIGDITNIEKAKKNIDILVKHASSELTDFIFTGLSESSFNQFKQYIVDTHRIDANLYPLIKQHLQT